MSGFIKDSQGWFIVSAPGDVRNYSIEWEMILDDTEHLTSSSWTLSTGVSKRTEGLLGFSVTTCQVSTQKAGTYKVSNTVTTSAGQTFTRGFRIVVR